MRRQKRKQLHNPLVFKRQVITKTHYPNSRYPGTSYTAPEEVQVYVDSVEPNLVRMHVDPEVKSKSLSWDCWVDRYNFPRLNTKVFLKALRKVYPGIIKEGHIEWDGDNHYVLRVKHLNEPIARRLRSFD